MKYTYRIIEKDPDVFYVEAKKIVRKTFWNNLFMLNGWAMIDVCFSLKEAHQVIEDHKQNPDGKIVHEE